MDGYTDWVRVASGSNNTSHKRTIERSPDKLPPISTHSFTFPADTTTVHEAVLVVAEPHGFRSDLTTW